MSASDDRAVKTAPRPAGEALGSGLEQRAAAVLQATRLPHLLLIAVFLRLVAMAVSTPVHPDEVFQYLETAHRLIFGQGVVTWEWRYGMRGWLLPLLAAVPMKLGAWLAPDSGLYLTAPNLAMVAASMVTVVAAWKLGDRISRLHAQVAGLVAAVWYEFIYFAPHVMSETAAIALILPAAVLLTDRDRWTPLRLAGAAALLANAAALRFQYLPGIATLVVVCCGLRLRECWRPLLLGGLVGLLPSVACDVAMGGVPFAWAVENLRLNVVQNRSADFGSSGAFGYFFEVWPRLALWSIPLVLLAGVGARRYPALAAAAVVNLVEHSLVGHKEYRFILLSVLIAVLLAAIGTVDWALAVGRRDGEDVGRRKLGFLCIVWLLASLSCGFGGFRSQWMKFHPEMDAYAKLRGDPALCGLAVYRHDYSVTGGYAYLHRAVPMMYFTTEDTPQPSLDLAQAAGAVNTVLTAPQHASELPPAFAEAGCEGEGGGRVCLYRRPGPCAAGNSRFAINTVLRRLDQ
ncbi:MAG TPA: hypothetical protein VL358_08700 [Caulobacteraceae bacterium]|nr:hypothetical protein [Caulobacteraceae bacterium]